MSRRVRIGTCAGPADAALVRAMFSARGIAVVVGAEHHSSMLGGLGGSFLSLDIWVAEEDSEDAALLLRDLRDPGAVVVDDDAWKTSGDGYDGDAGDYFNAADDVVGAADTAADASGGHADQVSGDAFHLQIDRRRRTGIALLLGCCITFGTAHMFTRAWLRGIALGAIELVGILQLAGGHRSGTIAIVGAVAADVIGAVWRVWSAPTPVLPVARLFRR